MIDPLRKLVLFILSLTLFSASAQESTRAGRAASPPEMAGGLDGGGGLGQSSTPEQVRSAIAKAYELLRMPDYFPNIFLRFWVSEFDGPTQIAAELDPTPLFPSLRNKIKFDAETNTLEANLLDLEPRIESPVLAAMLSREPLLRDTGDCEQSSRSHADASTTAYSSEGTICFSVGNLTRIPPHALLGEVLGLLLHEALHLSGVREERIPEFWQTRFVRYFRIRFGALDKTYVREKTAQELSAAHLYLVYAEQLNNARPGDIKILLILGAFGRGLAALPYFLDPLALHFALNPENPDLGLNYTNSVLALYNLAKTELFYAPLTKGLEQAKIKRLIQELDTRLSEVHDNFYAFVDGHNLDGEKVRSSCRLPRGSFELEISFDQGVINIFGTDPRIFALIPRHECSPGTSPAAEPKWLFVPEGDVSSPLAGFIPTKKTKRRK